MTANMDNLHYHVREHDRHDEMRQKTGSRVESFFSTNNVKDRPNSVYTEFMESDWEMEEDDIYSDMEDLAHDDEISPRNSIGSSKSGGQPSFTTMSSYDEVQTPRSVRQRGGFPFPFEEMKQVEGPRGPHLFRSSMSLHSVEYQNALSLSPITERKAQEHDHFLQHTVHLTTLPTRSKRDSGPFRFTDVELDPRTLPEWTPEMVAQWMFNAGVELNTCERFVENDITGSILITLKFEDLKELGITSFGMRTRVWHEIHSMRNIQKPDPQPETPIEDEPDRKVERELRRNESVNKPKRKASKVRPKINDVISPLESVSIVGIEQLMPKPHSCSKGENCAKWKRNQKMIEAFKKDHPFVNIDEGGIIMVAGNPGNPQTAEAIDPFRPVSDAIPSVVASSDVMGPGDQPTLQYLQEATLRNVMSRDPQDNVRQFLDFQNHHAVGSSEVPPTPPFELYPQQQAQGPHARLRALPKLAIPNEGGAVAGPVSARATSARRQSQVIPSFREMSDQSASSEEATPVGVYRFGTPFSEMDVPVTMTSIPIISRDVSQSVPPDMNYRHNPAPPTRSMSRATIRRPSFPVMPALDENSIVTPLTAVQPQNKSFSRRATIQTQRPLQPPPRVQYPWSQTNRTTFERAIAPMPGSSAVIAPSKSAGTSPTESHGVSNNPSSGSRLSPTTTQPTEDMTNGEAVSYQGLMKKRKTKMLRHEWHEHYFKLRGTRLTMHKDAATANNKTLEYIDIDDYAIACSSNANTSKLNAAFKAMHIRRGSGDAQSKEDIAAFSFQLIPQDGKAAVKGQLRKRENSVPGPSSSSAASASGGAIHGAVNGTGKMHHFAVKSRDERIDWMRELMLAKALKQKGEGAEVVVNGSMI
ncbi:uncharacterized protein B0T23DRAFT_76269 [Neurospora hispaniola]|uniref:SAM and PH domain-containing protein n=1 Tax=Neurospora hispaniola TaxID=588809 RepID=A0AAJ0ICS8_9PEZI|nr:hypothetical protein B0T23DRAFT_76269 [Neurospora hispaniola]